MSEKIPVVRGDELCRVLERCGFALRRIRGSHHYYVHQDGRRTSVPVHARKNVAVGTLLGILRDVEITPDELRNLI